jgi:hypothetical protein
MSYKIQFLVKRENSRYGITYGITFSIYCQLLPVLNTLFLSAMTARISGIKKPEDYPGFIDFLSSD